MARPIPSKLLYGATLVAAALLAPAGSVAAPKTTLPFPYDPLCQWGRLSDGKGFVIRCLSEKEAVGLGAPPSKVASASTAPPTSSATPAAPTAPDALTVELGPVTADSGALPEALQSLRKANDRYLDCVQKNGGLSSDTAEVQVRFLVRGRGRAEGTTVKKRRGVSEVAAKCIADVVDRRFVGYPESEMMGATLLVKVRRK